MDTLMLQANLGTFREREIDRKYLDALENLKKRKPDPDNWATGNECTILLKSFKLGICFGANIYRLMFQTKNMSVWFGNWSFHAINGHFQKSLLLLIHCYNLGIDQLPFFATDAFKNLCLI
jgi:hypothetical protein